MSNGLPDEAFLARWLNGELTENELREWYANSEYQDLKKIATVSGQLVVPEGLSRKEAWEKLMEKVEESETPPKEKTIRVLPVVRWTASMAAVIAAIFVVYLLNRSETVSFSTPAGEKYTLYLPDSSRVILNAESQLSYDKAAWSEKRSLNLTGEAYFEVRKGEKFTVNSQMGKVEVLGTRFNVKDRLGESEIACYEGRVRVSSQMGNASREITEGMGVKISTENRLSDYSFVSEDKPRWTDGKFVFNEAPFNFVIEEFERQYKVQVSYPKINSLYTGAFFDNDLKNALLLICEPMGLTYEFTDSTHIKLSRNP